MNFEKLFNECMIEGLSLESDEYKEITRRCDEFFKAFFEGKKRAPHGESRSKILEKFRKNQVSVLKRFFHEYEMVSLDKPRSMPIIGLPPILQKKVIYNSKYQCKIAPNLKPIYNVQGKMGETAFSFLMKSWFYYWGFDLSQIRENNTMYSHGGDLGSDLEFGKFKIDVKYRNDGPSSGLILRDNFLGWAPDDVNIVLTTNATRIHLGSEFNKKAAYSDIEDVFPNIVETIPVAITGWISKEEFMEKKTGRGRDGAADGIWVVDNLRELAELLFDIIEDQIISDDLFVL